MNTTIWKYPLPAPSVGSMVVMDMPRGARILSIQIQHGGPTLWAAVDPEAEMRQRKFTVRGTGHADVFGIKDDEPFIGTFQQGPLVFHVFDNGER